MRIELIRTVKHEGRTYTKGDVITASDGLGTYFCACGWARDLSGATPTSPPPTDPIILKVQSAKHATKSTERR